MLIHANEVTELAAQTLNHAVPVAKRRLTEQSRARVPPAALARARPAPIGRERNEDPDRTAHGACKVRDRSVHRDHEIDKGEDGGCIGEIVELRADLYHARFLRQQFGVAAAQLALNGEEARRAGRPERSEAGERNRPLPVVHLPRLSAPTPPPPLPPPPL